MGEVKKEGSVRAELIFFFFLERSLAGVGPTATLDDSLLVATKLFGAFEPLPLRPLPKFGLALVLALTLALCDLPSQKRLLLLDLAEPEPVNGKSLLSLDAIEPV